MNVLIVHAHENPDSFSTALCKTAVSFFENKGDSVRVSDLYEMGFNPVGGKHDFKSLSEATYYKYAMEQLYAYKEKEFSTDIQQQMDAVEQADVLILNFPLWWFGLPAILKGWIDRVFAYGFAYGNDYGIYGEGRFKSKKAFLSISTGSPDSFYEKEGMHKRELSDILRNIKEGILGLVGYTVLPSFVTPAVSRISKEERIAYLEQYTTYLDQEFSH